MLGLSEVNIDRLDDGGIIRNNSIWLRGSTSLEYSRGVLFFMLVSVPDTRTELEGGMM